MSKVIGLEAKVVWLGADDIEDQYISYFTEFAW